MKRKEWTLKEIKYIKDNYNKVTVNQASEHLKRPQPSVRHQAYRLGLRFRQEWEVLDYAYYKGDELVCIGKIEEIERFSGVTKENLLKYRFKCYEKRLKRKLIAI